MNLTIHRRPNEPLGDLSDVHLWILDLDEVPDDVPVEVSALSAEERERWRRLKEPIRQRRFAARCSLLRHVLAAILRTSPDALEFVAGPLGKPELVGLPIQFNLSHAENVMWLAATIAGEVGVDVEIIPPVEDVMLLAEDQCTPEEIRFLRNVPEVDRTAAFYRLWTRREAHAKATGRGIARSSDGQGADGAEDRILEWEVRWELTDERAALCGAVVVLRSALESAHAP